MVYIFPIFIMVRNICIWNNDVDRIKMKQDKAKETEFFIGGICIGIIIGTIMVLILQTIL